MTDSTTPGTRGRGISSLEPLSFTEDKLLILDQTLLPAQERTVELGDAEAVADAIERLAVRGAPLIGVAAAYGLALAAAQDASPRSLERAATRLRTARPTAANLARAVDRVLRAALTADASSRVAAARAEARAIEAEEVAASGALAAHGADLLAGATRVLTHCNTGALAAGGLGTALAVIAELAQRGELHVYSCETRPLLQGARLTVWELHRLGLSHELIVDGAAPGLIRSGAVDAVIVGCDRVAANGDFANKVGTYGLALAAHAARIPFVVAGPTSSIDTEIGSGDEIVIEERDADEVRFAGTQLLTLPGTPCRNPAFDVTPAELVTALVTERGIARPPTSETVAALLR